MSKKTDETKQPTYPEPRILQINDDIVQYECVWPGCEFDTFDKIAYDAHVDPLTGRHRDKNKPTAEPVTDAERAELEALRERVGSASDPVIVPTDPPKES